MNIYSKHGDKVRLDGLYGLNFDKNWANKHLTIGDIYTVDHTEVHSFSTKVFLVEVPGISFNSVLFSDVIERKTFDELSDKFHDLLWPDGEHVLTNGKDIEDALEKFDLCLKESGWTDDEWMSELWKRIKEDEE